MRPQLSPQDPFEAEYTAKFQVILARHGIFLWYDRDRAGIDIGLHLAQREATGGMPVTTTKVWFQLKGKHTDTLSLGDFKGAETVPVEVPLRLLRFWYASPEAIYVALYVESADLFIAEDVRDIVDRQWGQSFFDPSTFNAGQQEVTIRLRTDAVLDEGRVDSMLSHRSMRIDGPEWRGRPLGHGIDPLRSEMNPLVPEDFRALAQRLLDAHGFEVQEELDATTLLGGLEAGSDRASLTRGLMRYTYEWTHPLFTELGYDPGSTFRLEGEPFYVQGPCAVLIHEEVATLPSTGRGFTDLATRLQAENHIGWLLVFVNIPTYPSTYFGACRRAAAPLQCIPQELGSLAFNVLTATTVYLDFREKITWRDVSYIR